MGAYPPEQQGKKRKGHTEAKCSWSIRRRSMGNTSLAYRRHKRAKLYFWRQWTLGLRHEVYLSANNSYTVHATASEPASQSDRNDKQHDTHIGPITDPYLGDLDPTGKVDSLHAPGMVWLR